MTMPTTTETSKQDELKTKLENKRAHIKAVQTVCGQLIDMTRDQVRKHDSDKIERLEAGHLDKDMSHYETQSHHWWATRPESVTVMDLLEAVSDMVAVARVRDNACEVPLGGDLYRDKAFRRIIENTIHTVDPKVKVKFFDAKTYKF